MICRSPSRGSSRRRPRSRLPGPSSGPPSMPPSRRRTTALPGRRGTGRRTCPRDDLCPPGGRHRLLGAGPVGSAAARDGVGPGRPAGHRGSPTGRGDHADCRGRPGLLRSAVAGRHPGDQPADAALAAAVARPHAGALQAWPLAADGRPPGGGAGARGGADRPGCGAAHRADGERHQSLAGEKPGAGAAGAPAGGADHDPGRAGRRAVGPPHAPPRHPAGGSPDDCGQCADRGRESRSSSRRS